MLKVIARPWLSFSKQILIRSFKRGTVRPCRLRGCKNIRGQSTLISYHTEAFVKTEVACTVHGRESSLLTAKKAAAALTRGL